MTATAVVLDAAGMVAAAAAVAVAVPEQLAASVRRMVDVSGQDHEWVSQGSAGKACPTCAGLLGSYKHPRNHDPRASSLRLLADSGAWASCCHMVMKKVHCKPRRMRLQYPLKIALEHEICQQSCSHCLGLWRCPSDRWRCRWNRQCRKTHYGCDRDCYCCSHCSRCSYCFHRVHNQIVRYRIAAAGHKDDPSSVVLYSSVDPYSALGRNWAGLDIGHACRAGTTAVYVAHRMAQEVPPSSEG